MCVCVRRWGCVIGPGATGGESLRGARGRSVVSCLCILSSDNAMRVAVTAPGSLRTAPENNIIHVR